VDGVIVRGAFTVHKGQRLEIGAPTAGVHCYLAVRGGIDVPEVLGSRSADTLSGIGPPPLKVGVRLPFGVSDGVPFAAGVEPEHSEAIELRIRFGPRESWFRAPEELTWNSYRMGMSNRIGARLTGPSLARSIARELPSEGLVEGAVQVPGDGMPIIFLAVHPADVPLVAQARPGTKVMFRGP
jgi:allophanate hydrolase subunit 2